jgi:hypothetical protein
MTVTIPMRRAYPPALARQACRHPYKEIMELLEEGLRQAKVLLQFLRALFVKK